MPLYQIQDDDRPGFVFAINFQAALEKYAQAVASENDGEALPPKGIVHIADDTEIIISHNWVA